MTDSQRVAAILKKARDLYVGQVCEYVLANEADILANASGQGFDTDNRLYELGERLREINLVLSNLPDEPPAAAPAQVQVVTVEPISFQLWAMQIRKGDFPAAAMTLSVLLGVPVAAAGKCNEHFVDKLARDPNLFDLLSSLGLHIRHSLNNSVAILTECFNLQGKDAVDVALHLRSVI